MDLEIRGSSSQEKLVANLLAQALALAAGQHNENPNRHFAGNRPSSILMADRLTPYTMGGLLALYEAKIVMQGFIWNINSFDQEGVQLGKVLANRFLAHLDIEHRQGVRDMAEHPESWTMLEAAGIVPEQ
jgi:glucose-6-phosphate isomerase